MPGPIDITLDAPTSRAVAQGIGEKLRQTLRTEADFPDKLQELLDELHRREEGHDEASRPAGDRRR